MSTDGRRRRFGRCNLVLLLFVGSACGSDVSESIVALPPYPNEPPGSSVLIDWDFDIANAGDPPFFYVSPGPATTVTDVTAPINPSKVGRIQFSPALSPGSGPSVLASNLLPPANWKTWYFSTRFKVSSNFINEMTSPEVKIWDMLLPEGSLILMFQGAAPPFHMRFDHFVIADGSFRTDGTIQLQRNTWYHVELLVTDVGSGDARYQVFVDGRLDIDRTLKKVSNAEFKHNWVMGGASPGDQITVTSYMYHDHTRFSYTTSGAARAAF